MTFSHKYLTRCLFAASALLMACEQQQIKPISYFEQAEADYRVGRYGSAIQNYTAFLMQNPDPQLERLAVRRKLSIEREIECVQNRNTGPRPAYVSPDDTADSIPVQLPSILLRKENK